MFLCTSISINCLQNNLFNVYILITFLKKSNGFTIFPRKSLYKYSSYKYFMYFSCNVHQIDYYIYIFSFITIFIVGSSYPPVYAP